MAGYLAGGNISRGRFVKPSSSANNTVIQCVGDDYPSGISQYGSRQAPLPGVTAYAAQSGDSVNVHEPGEAGEVRLEIGSGGVTRGQFLVPDSDGAGIVGTQYIGARALESAAEGELCLVVPINSVAPTPAGT